MILVTGGLGYIGSHTIVELLNKNYEVVIVDNLSNSSTDVIGKIKDITGKLPIFEFCDLVNLEKVEKLFQKYTIEYIIHFAALKSVGNSVVFPLVYYHNNIVSTLNLLSCCEKYGVYNFIFSSSGTVYGKNQTPFSENQLTGISISNPYSKTKYFIEEILKDFANSNQYMNIISLRYFNPIGAHPTSLIGENPNGIPNNLMPYLVNVAINNNTKYSKGPIYDQLKIYGDDYETLDGTAIRDYIHVVDLAEAHIKSINFLENRDKIPNPGDIHFWEFNVGTGIGISVKRLVEIFKEANNVSIPVKIVERRPGDIAEIYSNCDKIKNMLDWKPIRSIEEACRDSYNYALNNL